MDNIESTNLQTHESEEKETKDSKTEEERSRVLVSDCLSDPQKNSSITCGFPFSMLYSYL